MSADSLPLVLLVGPTGVGKTEIAIELGTRLGAELISADSRLFYRGMDIGTAKPSVLQQQQIPHHLIDIVDPDETLSLAVFQEKAREAITNIHQRGKLPLLVGGTGQYVRAVTEGWTPPEVQPDPRLRRALEKMKADEGPARLHQKLQRLDPAAARHIDARNARRTIRALEVILTTGHLFSEQRRRLDSPYHRVTVGLTRPRPALYARIDARIDAMFEAGLLDEVQQLLARGYTAELPSMSAIGYRECVRVLRGQLSLEEAKTEMRRATRTYVRRQSNWFKESDPHIRWFYAAEPEIVSTMVAFIRDKLHE